MATLAGRVTLSNNDGHVSVTSRPAFQWGYLMNEDLMRKMGFGKEVELVKARKCPFCKKEIDVETEFMDELSKREFEISGLCQSCQDRVFV